MIELEPSFWNRTGRRNDKWAKGHETAHGNGQKYRPIWVSVLVSDLNRNSGFGCTLLQILKWPQFCTLKCQMVEVL